MGWCLDPVSLTMFLDEYWERRPLAVPRSEPGRFDDLLSTEDVERLVCSGGLRYPAFRLVKAESQLSVRDYAVDLPWRPVPFSGTADVDRVVGEFEAGATIVLQGLHLQWSPLARFCRALESALGQATQANAYYTPRDSQGLGVHHDTHDVLCLQVSGVKRWRVYDPVFELPLKDQRYSAGMGEPGEPVLDLVLQPGDTLYLPRGWLHEALTSDADSLHLTIGINVHTWLDAVRAAVEECKDDIALRRSVPEDGHGGEAVLETLARRLRRDQVARRRRERFLRTRRAIREGEFTQRRSLAQLTPQTPVERRNTVLADLRGDEPVVLVFDGKEVAFPSFVREDLEYLLGIDGTFSAADLPGGLDPDGRLVLVRRLVREGLLRIP